MSLSTIAPASGGGELPLAGEGDRQVERRPRTNLFLAARLAMPNGERHEVRIRNLSASGARIELASPPAVGMRLLLCRGGAEAQAEVVWSAAGSCGLRFTADIDVARWISDRSPAATAISASVSIKREPSLADDLALARQLLDRLEQALAAEPALVAALGTELQAVDLLGQLLRTSEKRAAGSMAPTIRSLWQAAVAFLRRPPYARSGPR